MKFLLFAILAAPFAAATPIPVSGSGSWGTDPRDSVWSAWGYLSGSTEDGRGVSISMSGSENNWGLAGLHGNLGSCIIDGQAFANQFTSRCGYTFGGTQGTVVGYDAQNRVVVSEALTGAFSFTTDFCNQYGACQGSWRISHMPEPGGLVLGGVGLLLLLGWQARA